MTAAAATQSEVDKSALGPPCAYLLADHLDAVLAAGEDLVKAAQLWPAVASRHDSDVARVREEQHDAIDAVQALELTVVVRLITARERARELLRAEDRFAPMVELFLSGTAMIADAAPEIGSGAASATDFDAPDRITPYLRSRGLIAPDAAQLPDGAPLAVSNDFLIAGRVPLGVLLELVDIFLETLETYYDLFATEYEREDALRSGATAAA